MKIIKYTIVAVIITALAGYLVIDNCDRCQLKLFTLIVTS